jgi:hypothetical protein
MLNLAPESFAVADTHAVAMSAGEWIILSLTLAATKARRES